MAGFWTHQVDFGRVEQGPDAESSIPGYPKEEGLLDFLGRLRPADSSVQMSRLVSTLFLAQNAFLRDANSGKIISESSSIR